MVNGFAENLAALFGERFLSRLKINLCWTAQQAATRHAALEVKPQQNLSIVWERSRTTSILLRTLWLSATLMQD